MKFISDYDKVFAAHFKLTIIPNSKGGEWHHKDGTMSQPSVIVLGKEAEVSYSWIAQDASPFGRPDPEFLWSALSKTLDESKEITEKALSPHMAGRSASLGPGRNHEVHCGNSGYRHHGSTKTETLKHHTPHFSDIHVCTTPHVQHTTHGAFFNNWLGCVE